jgi:hypothetical protein
VSDSLFLADDLSAWLPKRATGQCRIREAGPGAGRQKSEDRNPTRCDGATARREAERSPQAEFVSIIAIPA